MMAMINLRKFTSEYFLPSGRSCACWLPLLLMILGEFIFGSIAGDLCVLLAGILLFLLPREEEVLYVQGY